LLKNNSFLIVLRGYQFYKEIWYPQVVEELGCELDINNRHDRYGFSISGLIVPVSPGYTSQENSRGVKIDCFNTILKDIENVQQLYTVVSDQCAISDSQW